MKIRVYGLFLSLFLAALLVLNLQPAVVHAQSTAFSYQGQLAGNGVPVNGTYNMTFSLFNAVSGGGAIAGPLVTNGVVVNNGLFYVAIDFGAGVWNGQTNWLQIGVETNGATSFTTLAPRQKVLPVPYAIFANSASNLVGTLPATQLSGALPLAQLPASVVTNNESSSVTMDNLTLDGTLNLPGELIIKSGGDLLMYTDTNLNFFSGPYAGDSFTSGRENTADGYQALGSITSGGLNTASGFETLIKNETGSDNTADGADALYQNLSGGLNTAVGFSALGALGFTNGAGGYDNIALGASAGAAFQGNESYNIDIGNIGVIGESGVVRIGTPGFQTAAYIAGEIFGDGGLTNLSISQSGPITLAQLPAAVLTNNETSSVTLDNLTLNGALNLPATPVTINSGGSLLLRADNNENFFSGPNAGNLTTSGIGNTAVGDGALQNNTSGASNTANGNAALYSNTSGNFNMADGAGALYYNKSGNVNTAVGWGALQNIGLGNGSGGTNNIALGYNAGAAFTENESSNIDIGNTGVPGENGVIRIGTPGIQTATYLSGTVYANGVALTSDRNAKENFAAVNAQAVLDKVVALPVSEWNYKSDRNAEHIGPMAQDFHAAFGLDGADDKHISVVDEGGVALAAIQGLNEKLEAENAELKKQLNDLETQVKALSEKKQ